MLLSVLLSAVIFLKATIVNSVDPGEEQSALSPYCLHTPVKINLMVK